MSMVKGDLAGKEMSAMEAHLEKIAQSAVAKKEPVRIGVDLQKSSDEVSKSLKLLLKNN